MRSFPCASRPQIHFPVLGAVSIGSNTRRTNLFILLSHLASYWAGWQLARLVNEMGVLDDIVTPERDPQEEPQRRYGLIEGRNANAARRQMKLVAAHVLKARRIG